ncbi:MAG: hypothetical protein SFU98_03645 [Leptospiraceae bacterium]|nr:hypothetical protein [Leptospiraceae bacterium]
MKFFRTRNLVLLLLILNLQKPCDVKTQSSTIDSIKEQMRKFTGRPQTIGDSKTNPKIIDSSQRGTGIDSSQGWGGSPKSLNENSSELKEYFYVLVKAKASSKAILANSNTLMQSTCVDAAKLTGLDKIFANFMNAYFLNSPPEESRGTVKLSIPETGAHYTCKYSPSEDGKIYNRECKGFLKDYGISACASIGDSWSECQCLAYIKFPGGKDSINNRLSYE